MVTVKEFFNDRKNVLSVYTNITFCCHKITFSSRISKSIPSGVWLTIWPLVGWPLAFGGWLLAVGCWLLAVGCWLLAVGCWLRQQLKANGQSFSLSI
jgi:uncharacterized membrane protein